MKINLKQKIYNKLPEKNRDKIAGVYHVCRAIKNIVCWLLIIALALTVILSMVTRFSGKTPSVFGYTLQRVSTGSMIPTLEIGDVILSRTVSDVSEVKEGDIITFKGRILSNRYSLIKSGSSPRCMKYSSRRGD